MNAYNSEITALIGEPALDQDLLIFSQLLGQLSSLNEDPDKIPIVLEALKTYLQFARYHFMHEESRMKEISFVGYAVHRQAHQDFIARLESYLQVFESGTCSAKKIVQFLHAWLTMHLANEDKDFAYHLSLCARPKLQG